MKVILICQKKSLTTNLRLLSGTINSRCHPSFTYKLMKKVKKKHFQNRKYATILYASQSIQKQRFDIYPCNVRTRLRLHAFLFHLASHKPIPNRFSYWFTPNPTLWDEIPKSTILDHWFSFILLIYLILPLFFFNVNA